MDRWRDAEAQPWWKRLAWMAAIWTASVMALAALAELLKLWIG